MYKIFVTEAAQNDLKEAADYIANELKNRTAALHLLHMVEKEAYSLSEMPKRYPLIDDEFLKSEGFRFSVINNYLLFYVVRDETKTVVIERFLYARRNWIDMLNTDGKK